MNIILHFFRVIFFFYEWQLNSKFIVFILVYNTNNKYDNSIHMVYIWWHTDSLLKVFDK